MSPDDPGHQTFQKVEIPKYFHHQSNLPYINVNNVNKFERKLLRERHREGIALAKQRTDWVKRLF